VVVRVVVVLEAVLICGGVVVKLPIINVEQLFGLAMGAIARQISILARDASTCDRLAKEKNIVARDIT
jgi:heterodisulfide reductase subunit B